jgi:hypothetical protein
LFGEKRAFGVIVGEVEGAPVGSGGLVEAAEAYQKVGLDGRQVGVAIEAAR